MPVRTRALSVFCGSSPYALRLIKMNPTAQKLENIFAQLKAAFYFCHANEDKKRASLDRLGNSSINIEFRGKLLSLMAGRTLRGMLDTADYKDDKALKSCQQEFLSFHSVASFFNNRQRVFSDSLCFCIN